FPFICIFLLTEILSVIFHNFKKLSVTLNHKKRQNDALSAIFKKFMGILEIGQNQVCVFL
ncbi:hypothetical protein ABLW17_10825, partial [Anaerococcus murdochii]|uniref:hypothetical protein n=1 Tax=Anaerococcus murdochii TaxID=411577 RepID=UPI0032B585CB